MNSKAMTLSLFMAGIAVFFVMSSVTSIEEEAKRKFGDNVTVLVAKTDIKEMDTILETMVEPRVIPRRFVEPSAINFDTEVDENSKDYAMEIKNFIGNVAVVPIKQGEQLSLNKITEPNIRTGLAPQVAPGRRAISITVDETSSVSKLIKPGDRVDIIAVIDVGSNNGRENKVAQTVLQDVAILAVGRNITNNVARKIAMDVGTGKPKVRSLTDFDGYSSVTIEVDPAQAQLVAAISSTASSRMILTLRNNDDTDRVNLGGVRPVDAFSVRSPAGNRGGGRE